MKNKILRLFFVALLIAFQAPLAIGQGNAPGRVMGEVFMNRSTDLGTGQVFFVDDSGSNEPGQGGADFPFASLDYAVGRCATAPAAASTGCTIFLMEGHAETLIAADGVDIDVAGIKIIGMGTGNLRATFTMATAAAAEINVDAANVYLANIIIVDNIACTACIELTANADGFHADNILIREGSQQPAIMIDMVGQADDVLIENSTFLVPTADTGATGIDLSALTPARFTFRNNIVRGDFNAAAMFGSGALTDMLIDGNVFENALAGQYALEFSGAALGIISNNHLISSTAITVLDPGSANTFGNKWSVGIDQASVPFPEYSEFVPGLGYRVVKTSNDLTGDDDPIFTVTGVIAITLLIGEVTTTIDSNVAVAGTLLLETSNDIAISAATTITADADGTMYYYSGDRGEVLNGAQIPVLEVASVEDDPHNLLIVGNAGATVTIRTDIDGAFTAGVIQWIMYYIPVSTGATVVAA